MLDFAAFIVAIPLSAVLWQLSSVLWRVLTSWHGILDIHKMDPPNPRLLDLENAVQDLEEAAQVEQSRNTALRDALRKLVNAEFGVGLKLDALRDLQEILK